jgi:hypothetical protein
MLKRLYRLLGLVGVITLAGCANGPGLRFRMTFEHGPKLTLDFGATPVSTNSAPVLAP